MNIKIDILNVPKHDNKHDLILGGGGVTPYILYGTDVPLE